MNRKPKKLDQVAREFAERVAHTAKHRDVAAEARREKQNAEVAKALAEHLARSPARKK